MSIKEIGQEIRKARRTATLSMISKESGVSVFTIWHLANGTTRKMHPVVKNKIETYLMSRQTV